MNALDTETAFFHSGCQIFIFSFYWNDVRARNRGSVYFSKEISCLSNHNNAFKLPTATALLLFLTFEKSDLNKMSSVPLYNDPKATAKVQSCLKDVYKCVQAVEKERAANVEGCQAAIEAAHEKIVNDDRLTVAMRNRLKSLYEEGVRNAEKV